MVKLKDIADHLGVSVSTVSRVVNNKDRVNPQTRERILEALKKMNYQPNENARRLKMNASNVLGVIVPDISNPFYASVIKGIEGVAAQKGFSVILCNTDEMKEREKNAIQLLLRQKVAGIIVATTFNDNNVKKTYTQMNCPVVFFDNIPSGDIKISCVTIDNVMAVGQMVRYMIEQGHQRIFMISGPEGEFSADERVLGWRTALAMAGIIPGNDWLGYGDFREKSGREIMETFLAYTRHPTAVCIANNFMAYGAVKAILDAGLSIPGDISIGAFDMVDRTGLINLKFSTIIEPAENIGIVAAELCMQENNNEFVRVNRRIVLEHRFMTNDTISHCGSL